jgi:hypothetical protein
MLRYGHQRLLRVEDLGLPVANDEQLVELLVVRLLTPRRL